MGRESIEPSRTEKKRKLFRRSITVLKSIKKKRETFPNKSLFKKTRNRSSSKNLKILTKKQKIS